MMWLLSDARWANEVKKRSRPRSGHGGVAGMATTEAVRRGGCGLRLNAFVLLQGHLECRSAVRHCELTTQLQRADSRRHEKSHGSMPGCQGIACPIKFALAQQHLRVGNRRADLSHQFPLARSRGRQHPRRHTELVACHDSGLESGMLTEETLEEARANGVVDGEMCKRTERRIRYRVDPFRVREHACSQAFALINRSVHFHPLTHQPLSFGVDRLVM